MAWLQAVAKVAAKAGKPLRWTTPSGFVVCQEYRGRKGNRIKTRFCGSIVKFRTTEESDVIDMRRQCSGIVPNFVHSLDAAVMMLTVGACLDAGISSFAMIHDSYGTHAADTEALAAILRRSFVSMYEEHEVLRRFRDEVAATLTPEQAAKLPPLPVRGSLNLGEVLCSEYFFS
jgi:DNA-directed RNA polymerase